MGIPKNLFMTLNAVGYWPLNRKLPTEVLVIPQVQYKKMSRKYIIHFDLQVLNHKLVRKWCKTTNY